MSFSFQQFHVADGHCGMKVGTDAVTLGAVAPIAPGTATALDLGTGCGILPLMLAQRAPLLVITAVELMQGAALDAKLNFASSPFSERIRLIEGDVMEIYESLGKFDLVISNPPFFSETLHSPNPHIAQSRHGTAFNLHSLINIAPSLLNSAGSLAFIAPASRCQEIELWLELVQLNVSRRVMIKHSPTHPPVRAIYEATAQKVKRVETTLIINSPEYKSLTADFYLGS